MSTLLYCHVRLHLRFSSKGKVWQGSTGKMEPWSCLIAKLSPSLNSRLDGSLLKLVWAWHSSAPACFLKESSKHFLVKYTLLWVCGLCPNCPPIKKVSSVSPPPSIWQVLTSYNIFLLQDVFLLILQSLSFLSCNKNFMKIVVPIIWFLPHSDFKFESKIQFCKYVRNYPKIR